MKCAVCAKSLQPCQTLHDPVNCSMPGSSIHGILQVRILEWVAMPFSTGSSWPRTEPASLMSPALAGESFTTSAICLWNIYQIYIFLIYRKRYLCLDAFFLKYLHSCLFLIFPLSSQTPFLHKGFSQPPWLNWPPSAKVWQFLLF